MKTASEGVASAGALRHARLDEARQRQGRVSDGKHWKLFLTLFSHLDEGKHAKRVEGDVAAGSAAGVTGTPGFFIGKTKPDGTMVATAMKGAQPAAAFSQVIDRLLEEKTP